MYYTVPNILLHEINPLNITFNKYTFAYQFKAVLWEMLF